MAFVDSTYSVAGFYLEVPAFAKQLAFAALCGLVFGAERAFRQKVASLRTFAIIATGSCLFAILSVNAAGHSVPGHPYDVTRIAAQVVTGIGFVGGGVIFKHKGNVAGITTAAMIWMAAAVGMSVGFNAIDLASWAMVVYLILLSISLVLHRTIANIRLAQRRRR
ncbi:MAG: MgtC/SapB family protein, partial [Bdellovibrionales bacterium]|nr:MgtC/SapB family protein [Bdellovibrionales bacterium]